MLEHRIAHIENEGVTSALNDNKFTYLAEEALRQASRSTTSDRRMYLASLLGNSLSSDAI